MYICMYILVRYVRVGNHTYTIETADTHVRDNKCTSLPTWVAAGGPLAQSLLAVTGRRSLPSPGRPDTMCLACAWVSTRLK